MHVDRPVEIVEVCRSSQRPPLDHHLAGFLVSMMKTSSITIETMVPARLDRLPLEFWLLD